MSTNLTVNNNTYAYPTEGDEPGWGPDATGWATEVTTVLNDLQGANDIPETTANISNNQTTLTDIVGMAFNPAQVRGADLAYAIYRKTDTNEVAEKGQLQIIYKNGGTVGEKWSIGQVVVGDDAGVTFSMTDAGQIQYTSSDITGTNYSGIIKFEAKSILQ